MKKLLTLFVFVLAAMSAWAVDVDVDGISYYIYWSGSNSYARVIKPSGGGVYEGAITIPDYVNYSDVDIPVTEIGSSAFKSSTVTSVVLSKNLKEIAEYAFQDCSNLTSITLPESLENIGQNAFQGTGLTSVTIPGNVRKVNGSAFQDCANLTSVTFAYSENLTDGGWFSEKGVLLFNGGSIFANAPVTDLVVERPIIINDCPFTAVKRVTFGSHVTEIPKNMFYVSGDGLTLEQLTIGENVTEIGNYAFRNCTLPEGCTIPFAQFKKIGIYAFYQCKGLPSEVNLSAIEEIESNAFEQCTSIESLTIGGGTIGSYAFNGCSNLSSLTLLEGVTEIGSSNFSYLTALTTVNIPSTMKKIGPDAFAGCSNMTIPNGLPEGLETIDVRAFQNCKMLVVTIPSTVTSLGQGAFSGCESLTEVTIPAGVTGLGMSTFYGCKGLTSITIPGTLLSMGSYDLGGCDNLKEIIFEKGAEPFKINSDYAFSSTPVTKLYFDRVIEAPYKGYLFNSGTDIEVEFGPNCTAVGDYLLSSLTNMKSIKMSDNVKSLGEKSIYRAKAETLQVSKKLESIGTMAFMAYTFTDGSFTIPFTVTEIGEAAFGQFRSWGNTLKNVYVPWLTPLAIEDNEPEEDNYGDQTRFAYADNQTLWVPGGTMDAYRAAPIWMKFKNFDYWSFVVNAAVTGKGTIKVANGEAVTDNGTNTEKSVTGTALVSAGASEPVSGLFVREKDVTFTTTPARGYELSTLTANDADIKEASKVENLLADQTISATFTPIIYNITYDLKGGEVATANPATYTIESGAIKLNNPTRTGYTFKGWTGTDLTEATVNMTIPAESIGDRSYVATWEPTVYNITYDLDGGTVSPANKDKYTIETPDFTLTKPKKKGHNFTGWTGTDLSGKTMTVTITKGHWGDRSYTATWEPIIVGDADGDKQVTIADAEAIMDYIFGKAPANFNIEAANVNGDVDGEDKPIITIADAVAVIIIIMK